MSDINVDFCVVGGGSVGLTTAITLWQKFRDCSIAVIDKEPKLGLHSSGRNSGVIHAGIYYKPGTLRARICIEGAKKLDQWIKNENLPIKRCGKLIVAQDAELDTQLDFLLKRAHINGVEASIIKGGDIQGIFPGARSASERAIWSPNTSVTNPKIVISSYKKYLEDKNITFLLETKNMVFDKTAGRIKHDSGSIVYGHMFNCAGAYAVDIAHSFKLAEKYIVMPFKGEYYQIKANSNISIPANLYPVPNLDMPFLGVHFTPNVLSDSGATIGPSALLAAGRENYEKLNNMEPNLLIKNLAYLARQYILDKGKIRKYVHDQWPNMYRAGFLREAKKLLPLLSNKDIEKSEKIGIRAQLFNVKTLELEDDFISISGDRSTHILNAISPAFTSSFALSDHIVKTSGL